MNPRVSLQSLISNQIKVDRAEAMKTSRQLTLIELILKLDSVVDKALPVVFDVEGLYPGTIDSWRGAYSELALAYESGGERPTVSQLLRQCNAVNGRILQGYKGGDFLMGKTTPLWASNYGDSTGFRGNSTAIIGLDVRADLVVIITEARDY
mgnify:FL=1